MKKILPPLLLLLGFSPFIFAQPSFSGVFREAKGSVAYWNNASWDSFVSKHKELRGKGYQLTDVEGRHVGKGKSGRFWGIWMKTKVDSRIISRTGWDEFVDLFKEQSKKGYYLDDVESMLNRKGNRMYVGVFVKGKKGQFLRKFRDKSDIFSEAKKYKSKHKAFLTDIDPLRTKDGKYQFLAIYTKGADKKTEVVSFDRRESFDSDRIKKRKAGLGILDYEKYSYKGKEYFMAIYRTFKDGGTTSKDSFWRGLKWYSFKAQRDAIRKTNGLKLVDIEVAEEKGSVYAPALYNGKEKDTPDIWQHMKKIEAYKNTRKTSKKQKKAKEFESNSFCGPTAVSNGMMYWIKNGYPKLDHKKSQIEMVKVLGSEDYMEAFDGTNLYDMTTAVKQYVEEKGYKLDGAYIQHISIPSNNKRLKKLDYLTYKTETETLDLKDFKKRVLNPKSICILLYGKYNKKKKDLIRQGGHFVTFVGYGQNWKGEPSEHQIIVHDPATGPDERKQRHIYPKELVGHLDWIKEKTKLKNLDEDGKVKWEARAKNKILVSSDGIDRFVLEGLIEYRIK